MFPGPFASAHPPVSGLLPSSHTATTTSIKEQQLRQLQCEDWFHGPISRRDAEARLQKVGDSPKRGKTCQKLHLHILEKGSKRCSSERNGKCIAHTHTSPVHLFKTRTFLSKGRRLLGPRISGLSRPVRVDRDAGRLQEAPASRGSRRSGENNKEHTFGQRNDA